MTYNKPEVVDFDNAVKTVQHSGKPSQVALDTVFIPNVPNAATAGAYEADE